MTNFTEPEPDLALLKYRPDDYKGKKALAEDALLVIEISDTTLEYDRGVKLPRYAAAGVPEVWIENLESDELIVCRNPAGSGYSTVRAFRRGDTVSIAAFPEVDFQVADFLV